MDPQFIAAAFQGGGARGIAYVGALKALEQRNYRFEAVAGTSAGSIVAVLVAAGAVASEIERLMPDLLSRVTTVTPSMLVGSTDLARLGQYSLESVRELLEAELRNRIRREPGEGDVTFRELYAATKIELNILVTVEPGTPMLLSAWTSPSCQVSYAVAASCAIPFVMNPQVLVNVPEAGDLDEVTRSRRVHVQNASARGKVVVDGGLWANFPIQCFVDASLRHYYGAPKLSAIPIVGFILDSPSEPHAAPKGRPHLRQVAQGMLTWFFDLVTETPGLLAVAGLALMAATAYYEYYLLRSLADFEEDTLPIQVMITLLGSVVLLILAVAGFGILGMSRYAPAAGVALRTVLGGLTSVTVKVPPWTGAHPHSRIIKVPASASLISTLDFTPSAKAVTELIETAQASVGQELDKTALGAAHAGRTTSGNDSVRFAHSVTSQKSGFRKALDEMGMR